ncbi:MAG TPA: hypothetical protein VL126_11100, partial [Bacteroidota bacterium]|nr:hypothetical protein [Bacteroidota bacterium]
MRACCSLMSYMLVVASIGLAGQADTTEIRSALIIKAPPGFPDNIARRDPIEEAIVEGRWNAPRPGESIRYNDTSTGTWEVVQAGPAGWYDHPALEAGYVFAAVDVKESASYLLEASGNSTVYVNGVPRSGNPYAMKDRYEAWEPRFDYSLLPMVLHKGRNEFLFHCTRGVLKAHLIRAPRPVFINAKDATLPDCIVDTSADSWGAVVIINASSRPLRSLSLQAGVEEQPPRESPVPIIQPLSVRKIAFRIRSRAFATTGSARLTLVLRQGAEALDTARLSLRIVSPADPRKETFLSSIDG